MWKALIIAAAVSAVLAACQQVPRTTPTPTPMPAVAAADARTLGLAQTVCAACHGANGVSVSEGIPNLAGQGARYLQRQLMAFRGGTRKHELMNVVAAGIAPSDAEPLARYFSQQPAPGASAPRSPLLPVFERSRARLPADFPIGFTHYSTTDDPNLKSVMHTWANEIALRASHGDGPMPDGAIIVSENWSARLDSKGELLHDGSGSLVPERVKSYGVMASGAGWGDAIPEALRNANWNYAVFKADRTPDASTNHAVCFVCHKSRAANQFVYTQERLAAASNGAPPTP